MSSEGAQTGLVGTGRDRRWLIRSPRAGGLWPRAQPSRASTVRLLGGVAVFLQAPDDKPLLHRGKSCDIDLVAPRDSKRALEPDLPGTWLRCRRNAFIAFHGHHRQLYVDLAHARKVDVFVGSFSMCHEIPIADRLDREPMTVPLAELLLTKLQIVQLNERDERDIYNLCFHHPVSATPTLAPRSRAG